jgi:putative ABC transport system permease protein
VFTAGVLGAFGSLALLAKGTSIAVKKISPDFLPYPWRQGLANLHRPNNQTAAVTLAIGLGTFLLVTLYGVRGMLLQEVAQRSGRGEPNLVLFDVQKDQREALAALLKNFNARLHETVPVVTLRLAAIKGRPVEEIRADPESKIPRWALRREYRSTYRSGLASTEQLVEGTWIGKAASDAQPIPISVEHGIAQTLGVAPGDRLEFELQGVPLPARVASIRQVDWQRVQPNFFVVFPEGVLEAAPQFYALTTRADSRRLSAAIQRTVVEGFPNVSIIDLTLVLSTLDSVLNKVSDAIRFIALFIVLTGFAVLAGAVLSSRSQRIKESILLRTLGASRSQIVQAIVAEYLFLGLIAATAGMLLGAAAGWGLTFYFIGTAPALSIAPLLAIPALAVGVTVAAGMLGCWGIFHRSALEALRAEA